MIVKPRISSLLNKVDSRYTLVSVVAKRAREITEGDKELVEPETSCTVSTASEELAEDMISYVKNENVEEVEEKVNKEEEE